MESGKLPNVADGISEEELVHYLDEFKEMDDLLLKQRQEISELRVEAAQELMAISLMNEHYLQAMSNLTDCKQLLDKFKNEEVRKDVLCLVEDDDAACKFVSSDTESNMLQSSFALDNQNEPNENERMEHESSSSEGAVFCCKTNKTVKEMLDISAIVSQVALLSDKESLAIVKSTENETTAAILDYNDRPVDSESVSLDECNEHQSNESKINLDISMKEMHPNSIGLQQERFNEGDDFSSKENWNTSNIALSVSGMLQMKDLNKSDCKKTDSVLQEPTCKIKQSCLNSHLNVGNGNLNNEEENDLDVVTCKFINISENVSANQSDFGNGNNIDEASNMVGGVTEAAKFESDKVQQFTLETVSNEEDR